MRKQRPTVFLVFVFFCFAATGLAAQTAWDGQTINDPVNQYAIPSFKATYGANYESGWINDHNNELKKLGWTGPGQPPGSSGTPPSTPGTPTVPVGPSPQQLYELEIRKEFKKYLQKEQNNRLDTVKAKIHKGKKLENVTANEVSEK